MKMFVGLVLFAAFALPAAFAAHQDVITLQAYEGLLKNGAAYGMTKTVISNSVLEEALFSYSKDKLGGIFCGETCLLGTCYTPNCRCNAARICVDKDNSFALPAAFASFEKKDFITRGAYENIVKSGAIESITMTKTIISSPILEEALVAYSKEKLGGVPICGETCFHGNCYTPGCSCGQYKLCYKNSLEQNRNKVGEEALVDFARKGLAAALAALAN